MHHTITTLLLAIGLGCGTPLLAGDSGQIYRESTTMRAADARGP